MSSTLNSSLAVLAVHVLALKQASHEERTCYMALVPSTCLVRRNNWSRAARPEELPRSRASLLLKTCPRYLEASDQSTLVCSPRSPGPPWGRRRLVVEDWNPSAVSFDELGRMLKQLPKPGQLKAVEHGLAPLKTKLASGCYLPTPPTTPPTIAPTGGDGCGITVCVIVGGMGVVVGVVEGAVEL